MKPRTRNQTAHLTLCILLGIAAPSGHAMAGQNDCTDATNANTGTKAMSCGYANIAGGTDSNALGYKNTTYGASSNAFGYRQRKKVRYPDTLFHSAVKDDGGLALGSGKWIVAPSATRSWGPRGG